MRVFRHSVNNVFRRISLRSVTQQLLAQLGKAKAAMLDGWELVGLNALIHQTLIERLNDHAHARAMLMTCQLLMEHRHARIGDPALPILSSIGCKHMYTLSSRKESR